MLLNLLPFQLEPVRLELFTVDENGDGVPVPNTTEYRKPILLYKFNANLLKAFYNQEKFTRLRFSMPNEQGLIETIDLSDIKGLSITVIYDHEAGLLWRVRALGKRG